MVVLCQGAQLSEEHSPVTAEAGFSDTLCFRGEALGVQDVPAWDRSRMHLHGSSSFFVGHGKGLFLWAHSQPCPSFGMGWMLQEIGSIKAWLVYSHGNTIAPLFPLSQSMWIRDSQYLDNLHIIIRAVTKSACLVSDDKNAFFFF